MVDKEFYLVSYFKVYSVSLLEVVVCWNLKTLAEENFYSEIIVYFARRIQCKTLHKNASSRVSVQYQKMSFCEPWAMIGWWLCSAILWFLTGPGYQGENVCQEALCWEGHHEKNVLF